MEKRSGRNPRKKRLFTSGLLLISIVLISLLLYFSFADKAPNALEKEVFAERTHIEMALDMEFFDVLEGKLSDESKEEIKAKEKSKKIKEIKEEVAKVSEEKVEAEIPVAPERDLTMIIANAKAHVYTINTDLEQGSGFLFNTKGDILTNAHVAKDASYVTLTNSDGQQFNGEVIGISDKVDIALIRVHELAGKQPMEFEASKVPVGTEVFALGSPENIANTSTEGKILSTGKSFYDDYQYDNLYEMDALIKKGSSGGPLIDAKTERILGINSIYLLDNPNIAYAIPIYTVVGQVNEWAANPIIDSSWSEDHQPIEDAYFEEELLDGFITSYYELIPYSLNDKGLDYYTSYLLAGSEGEVEGKKLIEEYREEQRVFDAVDPTIINIEIGEDEATVEVKSVFTYHDEESDEVNTIDHHVTYTVIIDEYGDYKIRDMETK